MTKTRGKYGTGMLDKAATATNKRKVAQKEKLDSIMNEIGKTRGKKPAR